jgi:hypothetical protein
MTIFAHLIRLIYCPVKRNFWGVSSHTAWLFMNLVARKGARSTQSNDAAVRLRGGEAEYSTIGSGKDFNDECCERAMRSKHDKYADRLPLPSLRGQCIKSTNASELIDRDRIKTVCNE